MYQSRTYMTTLENQRSAVVTVAAGPGEIRRLQQTAMARYGCKVDDCQIVEDLPSKPARHTQRWDVEVKTLTPVADRLPCGEWEHGYEVETHLMTVQAGCPVFIPSLVEERAPGWDIVGWARGVEPPKYDDSIF
jgi:hypothetical protein